MQNLRALEVDTTSYGTLLVLLINEKPPNHLRLVMAWQFKNEIWYVNEMLKLLKEELENKERSVVVGNSFNDNSEKVLSSTTLHLPQESKILNNKGNYYSDTYSKHRFLFRH